MDLSTLIGYGTIFSALFYSIYLGGSFIIFYDLPSFVMVIFGVIGGTMVKWPMADAKSVFKIVGKAFKDPKIDQIKTILEIRDLANKARKESIFALENAPVSTPFMKKAMSLAADNRPPDVIETILKMEIDAMVERHKGAANILNEIASDGPAYGMIGTLVGLVQMLQNLSDPSAIGPAMAVALLTTFYGAVLANVFALPLKNKVSARSGQESSNMNLIVLGTLGIVSGENPRLIIEKLSGMMSPSDRLLVDNETPGEEKT